MFVPPPCCPNQRCTNNKLPVNGWYAKKGYYRTNHNRQRVPRYRCKTCGRYFGSHSHSPSFGQHKPDVNAEIARLLCAGMTMRRVAKHIGIDRKTVARKLHYLAEQAREAHTTALASPGIKTEYVQFDEMETYEASKLKPLSIALAVRAKTGQILGAKVAEMNCHGKTASASVRKYGRRTDGRMRATKSVLGNVVKVSKAKLTIATDKKQAYRTIIKQVLPGARHDVYASRSTVSSADPHLCQDSCGSSPYVPQNLVSQQEGGGIAG